MAPDGTRGINWALYRVHLCCELGICVNKKTKSFMMKRKLARLKFQNFLNTFRLSRLVKLPSLHKGAALVMLIPLILQPVLKNVLVIDTLDLSFVPFFGDDYVITGLDVSVLILLPLFLVAAVISQWLVKRSANDVPQEQTVTGQKQTPNTSTNTTTGLDDLNREVLPVWNRQIESARKQSEVAVKDLAKQFGGISMRLNEAIQASVSYSNDGVNNIGKRDDGASGMISQQELAEMLDTLREAIDVKSVLLDKINELKGQTNDMKEVVSSVMSVSRKTEVLAINASIEARRAGAQGKSFGVVAQEVRKLSEQSEKMVHDVGDRIQLLEQKMDDVIAQTNMNANGPEDLSQQSNKTMSLYERFRTLALSLSKSSEILLVESSNIKTEINEILVALQYQDKTSQILIHVTDDMSSLHDHLEKNLATQTFNTIDIEGWMEKLYSTYTMVEEINAHKGEAQDFGKVVEEESSLEFF